MTEYADIATTMFQLTPQVKRLLIDAHLAFDSAIDGDSDHLYALMANFTDIDVVTDVAVVETAQVVSMIHVYPDTWQAGWQEVRMMPATRNPDLSREMQILAKQARDERLDLIETQIFPVVYSENDFIKIRDHLRICVTQMAFTIPRDRIYSNRLWKVAIASYLLAQEMHAVLDP